MPDSAPLNVADATVGFELDTITPRSIASARYVRHHEWLNLALENPQSLQSIVPPTVGANLKIEDLESRLQELEKEVAALEDEKARGWKFYDDEHRIEVFNNAVQRLRTEYGAGSTDAIQREVEEALGVEIAPIQALRPVEIRYKREQ